jgi:hypothetical protein
MSAQGRKTAWIFLRRPGFRICPTARCSGTRIHRAQHARSRTDRCGSRDDGLRSTKQRDSEPFGGFRTARGCASRGSVCPWTEPIRCRWQAGVVSNSSLRRMHPRHRSAHLTGGVVGMRRMWRRIRQQAASKPVETASGAHPVFARDRRGRWSAGAARPGPTGRKDNGATGWSRERSTTRRTGSRFDGEAGV